MVGELVKRWAPGCIEEALSLFKDIDDPPYFEMLSFDDISEMAREKMKRSQAHIRSSTAGSGP
jgi:hypothetical protein